MYDNYGIAVHPIGSVQFEWITKPNKSKEITKVKHIINYFLRQSKMFTKEDLSDFSSKIVQNYIGYTEKKYSKSIGSIDFLRSVDCFSLDENGICINC
jgi:hypothetical protein